MRRSYEQIKFAKRRSEPVFSAVASTSAARNQAVPEQHVCSTCGKGYKFGKNLKRHMKFECNKEKKYGCVICGKKYYYPFNVKNHVASAHRELYSKVF